VKSLKTCKYNNNSQKHCKKHLVTKKRYKAPHFDEFFEQKLNSKWSNLINY